GRGSRAGTGRHPGKLPTSRRQRENTGNPAPIHGRGQPLSPTLSHKGRGLKGQIRHRAQTTPSLLPSRERARERGTKKLNPTNQQRQKSCQEPHPSHSEFHYSRTARP